MISMIRFEGQNNPSRVNSLLSTVLLVSFQVLMFVVLDYRLLIKALESGLKVRFFPSWGSVIIFLFGNNWVWLSLTWVMGGTG